MCVCAFFFLFLEIGLEQARSGQAGPVSQTDRQTVNIHNKMQQTSKAKYDSVSAVGEYNIANSINVTRFDYNMEHMRIMRLPSFVRCFFVFCVFFYSYFIYYFLRAVGWLFVQKCACVALLPVSEWTNRDHKEEHHQLPRFFCQSKTACFVFEFSHVLHNIGLFFFASIF